MLRPEPSPSGSGNVVVEEPGRRIVQEELRVGGPALPWRDPIGFARRAIALALADRAAICRPDGWVFFDRGLIDAAAALQHLTGEPALLPLGQTHRYHRRVFLAPPWPEIYVTDPERRDALDAAIPEYWRLLEVYRTLGYEVSILPKIGVPERANFVLSRLNE